LRLRFPLHLRDFGDVVRETGQNKEKIRKTVQIDQTAVADVFIAGEPDDSPLSPPADSSCKVQPSRSRGSSGEDETLQRLQCCLKTVDLMLNSFRLFRTNAPNA
jgi:hypothetical protein